MHNKVTKLTGKNLKKKSSGCIIDKNRKLLFDKEKIAAWWVEYITELYDNDRDQMPNFEVTTGESILREEVEKVMRSMKDGKATGPDGLPAEALKAFNDYVNSITDLCNIISKKWSNTGTDETLNVCYNSKKTYSKKVRRI